MRRRISILLLSAAIGSFGLLGVAAPARATHACDPEFSVLCAHPQDLQYIVDFLCDEFVAVDKILTKLGGSCGTS